MAGYKLELTLYHTEGSSDKEYKVVLTVPRDLKCTVHAEFGKRGARNQVSHITKVPVSESAAIKAFDKAIKGKTKASASSIYTDHPSGDYHSYPYSGGMGDKMPLPYTPTILTAEAIAAFQVEAWSVPSSDELRSRAFDLLESASGAVQELPDGRRAIAMELAGEWVSWDGDAKVQIGLPDSVETDLAKAFSGYVLDGIYAAGVYHILDGYKLADSAQLEFKDRHQLLTSAIDAVPVRTLQLQRTFFDRDATEAAFQLSSKNAEVLIRSTTQAYARVSANDESTWRLTL